MTQHTITVAKGDGIGPEIMDACLRVLSASGANLVYEEIEIGEKLYNAGVSSGIRPEAWDSLRKTKVFYKAPITTPQGGGVKSLNVTVRKTFGLFANIRPCFSLAPYVDTRFPTMDVIIVRENEEDLYAGIEHRQTADVYQCLKLITRPGAERIIRYGFEFARLNGRKKVSCFTKDNIMKLTDGLFHKVFDEIGAEYPELEQEHWIVDIGSAKLADNPEQFDVIILPNLYGDILSDVAAEIAGSVGLAGSANIGSELAMFEAIHGSAPRRAGQNLANPSGLLMGGVQMLQHLKEAEAAERVRLAWLKAIEDGVHTYDIYKEGVSKERVGTKEFADAIIARMGEAPAILKSRGQGGVWPSVPVLKPRPAPRKELVGVDLFVDWVDGPKALGDKLTVVMAEPFKLAMVTNRGVKVYPDGAPETFCVDHYRCRYLLPTGLKGSPALVAELMMRVAQAGFDVVKTEGLYTFDGEPGFSLGQGQ
ncbi:MAG: NADP-dependent isocitrate dehydrogenase [Alphaproteobacteria bacterium]|jgi:isocitrate dehydrogenase|nr:NADP-dependent isocitrate dehydrogenase [Alphaproteobacteria bacterium]